MNETLLNVFYLAAGVLFIVALKLLTSPRTARVGNLIGAAGMLIAVAGTLWISQAVSYTWIIIGLGVGACLGTAAAMAVPMTAMPQMVSFFNGSGGLAAALVAVVELWAEQPAVGTGQFAFTAGLSAMIGCITFTGSMLACGKLQELITGQPIVFPLQKVLNALLLACALAIVIILTIYPEERWLAIVVMGIASLVGVGIVLPVGGADMPVVISLLNSLTGLAAAATGFLLGNSGLIISGALVGASGGILTGLMCKAMNRSLANVLFSAVGAAAKGEKGEKKTVRRYAVQDAQVVLESAAKVIVIPGYGLAVARAQHAVKELANLLDRKGVEVKYAVHPVAGRMPGHMNVLMAEADVPYSQLLDLEQGNAELESADVALIVGANDVVNPAAHDDPKSPIYGMPILNADKARTVLIIKRSLAPGFAGIDNALFYRDQTMMIFGDAKDVLTELVTAMKT